MTLQKKQETIYFTMYDKLFTLLEKKLPVILKNLTYIFNFFIFYSDVDGNF